MSDVDGEKMLLLQAALDGELDAAGMLAFERALSEDAELAAEYGRLQALRAVLRALPKAVASGALRGQIEAMAPRRASPRVSQWLPMGMAACLAFLLGGGLSFLVLPHPPEAPMHELIADHTRGLLSGQPVDVVSSERHTVKPWFGTHSALSPDVVDLASDGFPLIGGRLDVIGVTPVPTLVYRHAQHIVSLSEVPDSVAHFAAGRSSIDGYAVLIWRQGQTSYVAISDAMPAELDALAAAFRKAMAAEQ
jgi:anti-sigma factor RsiW